jgi:NAD(P)-dependent dehydrogenase (short-subunit alcohol dehydrogenase family)
LKEKTGDGTVVLVTGGASGIGRVIAESFVAEGASVHICDASIERIEEFHGDNADATASRCDVGNPDEVDGLFADLTSLHGRLDVLVNNVGISGPTAALEDIAVADWNRCIEVNLGGVFCVTRRAVPLLKQQRHGVIVNMSSNAGLFGCPNRSPYVASKWAIIGLTKTWAMELGPWNIRVNAVCPTSVEGERIEGVIQRDAAKRGVGADRIREVYQRQSSMRTFVTAADVANTVCFLASDLAARISGQAIAVDGHTETLSNWLDS